MWKNLILIEIKKKFIHKLLRIHVKWFAVLIKTEGLAAQGLTVQEATPITVPRNINGPPLN